MLFINVILYLLICIYVFLSFFFPFCLSMSLFQILPFCSCNYFTKIYSLTLYFVCLSVIVFPSINILYIFPFFLSIFQSLILFLSFVLLLNLSLKISFFLFCVLLPNSFLSHFLFIFSQNCMVEIKVLFIDNEPHGFFFNISDNFTHTPTIDIQITIQSCNNTLMWFLIHIHARPH